MRIIKERRGDRFRAILADAGLFKRGVELDPVIFVDICRRLKALEP